MDKSAVGKCRCYSAIRQLVCNQNISKFSKPDWNYHEKVEKHESQKGKLFLFLKFDAILFHFISLIDSFQKIQIIRLALEDNLAVFTDYY